MSSIDIKSYKYQQEITFRPFRNSYLLYLSLRLIHFHGKMLYGHNFFDMVDTALLKLLKNIDCLLKFQEISKVKESSLCVIGNAYTAIYFVRQNYILATRA